MSRYALLILPAMNKVYAEAAVSLSIAELEVMNTAVLGGRLSQIERTTLGGVPYLTFEADGGLSEADLGFLANLSSRYALFERAGDLLRPLPLTPLDQFDDDLITIQKYAGKTNEHFTKLLLNVTVLSSGWASAMTTRRFRIIDPLCGRGTTLNQALMYGYDSAGIELDLRDFEAYSAFIRTWLRRKRIKHHAETSRVRRDRAVVGRRLDVEVGVTRESYRAGDRLTVTMVQGDTRRAREFFSARSFDLLVTDAPYGVRHGSTTGAKLTRDPLGLLGAALPGWIELIRPGGAVGIAFNEYVSPRADMVSLLADHGLQVYNDGPYRNFSHWVDQAIVRDIVVARKPDR